ncbi:hypothetical protein Poly51_52470 [Rubripirellula tenax]|uniref:Chromo domain-containing protein n=1 Tax=Rubripirellula tenax TaxID=2528015 RepID=A0A5C6EHC5_9BACT|nr:DUF481 domain-containing protein [Rubripirellula tenax]TWU47447.1 hypothetical protein Poly51_52470 [Rubripirellula tenax]
MNQTTFNAFVIALAVVWTSGSAVADETTTPSWMRGVSTFNGTGYDLPDTDALPVAIASPAAPASTVSPAAPSSTFTLPTISGASDGGAPPYVVPVDPASPRSNPYVASQSVANPYFDMPRANTSAVARAILDSSSSSAPNPTSSSSVKTVSNEVPSLPMPLVSPSQSTDESYVGSSVVPASPSDVSAFDQAMGDQAAIDTPPLQESVTHWYQYPARWMKGWDSNAEFGIDGSGGNAETLALQTGLELKRKTDISTFTIDVDYRQASSRDTTIEDNGRFNLDYDRLLGDTNWSLFGKFGLEWDKFKAFDLRINTNAGLGYHWIRTDTATLVTRFGAGASKEIGSPDDAWSPEAVFGIEAERQLTDRQKLKGKVDYFPAWDDFNNYRLVADASWEMLLDGSDNLSLKLAATDRYDSTPQGARPNDIYYSLLLLYKF